MLHIFSYLIKVNWKLFFFKGIQFDLSLNKLDEFSAKRNKTEWKRMFIKVRLNFFFFFPQKLWIYPR